MQKSVSLLRHCAVAMPLSLLSAAMLHAQISRDSTVLPGVVVTADRIARPLSQTTSTVSVVTGDALRAAGVVQLADALRLIPGVNVARTGSLGAQTSLFLRGGESDYVRVLVDGVAMNDPGGAFDLSSLSLDNVERIEVVRGPASVLYGSDAVTGVVQIFTRRAHAKLDSRLALRGGSFGTTDADGSIAMRAAGRELSLGVADHRSDGMLAFNNDYRQQLASLRVSALLPGATTVTVTARSGTSRFAYPTDGSGNVVDHNAHRSDRRFSTSAELAHAFGNRVDGRIILGALELHGRTSDLPDAADDTIGFYSYRSKAAIRRRTAQLQFDVRPVNAQTLTFGAEYAGESQRSADSSNYDFSLNRFDANRITRAAFAQWVGEIGGGRLTYSVGGRVDDNDVYGTFRTGRLGAALRLWQGARARATVGNAFKAPTFLESFSTAFSVGNPSLRPERSRSFEGGIDQQFADGRVQLSAVWFDQRFRDLIQYTYRSPTDPNYFNVAAASSRGLETDVRLTPASGVGLWANATFLRTRVDDAGFQATDGAGATFAQGERLLRRAPRTIAVGVDLARLRRTHVQLSVLNVAARDDRNFASFPATPVALDAYSRVDLGGEYHLTSSTESWHSPTLTLRVENALAARYSEVFGFPAPRRVVLIGVRLGTAP